MILYFILTVLALVASYILGKVNGDQAGYKRGYETANADAHKAKAAAAQNSMDAHTHATSATAATGTAPVPPAKSPVFPNKRRHR